MGRAFQFIAAACLVISAGRARAATDPMAKCALAQRKAAVKKLSAKVKCYSKIDAAGVPLDPQCLTKAETQFDAAMTKAGAKGGCASLDTFGLEKAVDSWLHDLLVRTPAFVPGCGSSPYPECGGSCPSGTRCQPFVDDTTFACMGEPSRCSTGCGCVDDQAACNGKPCDGVCFVTLTCAGMGAYNRDEVCCSGGGGPCDISSPTPACCCAGSCVESHGSSSCQLGIVCDATQTATECR